MALPLTRPRRGGLTAAATQAGIRNSEYARRKSVGWQLQALRCIDEIPELNFWSRFYSRMLKQVRFYPAFLKSDETLQAIKTGPPVDALARIRDPGGGKAQILASYGRLMATTGEGCLFGRNLDEPDERWSFVWNDELEIEEAEDGSVIKITHRTEPGNKRTAYSPEKARVYRMWTSHPRNTGEADSPMRSIIEGMLADVILGLTASELATTKSRIVNGVLLIPEELSMPPVEAVGDEDPMNDPMLADVADVFEAQVANPGSAAARVPPILRGAFEYLPAIRHLTLHDPQTDFAEANARQEVIERLAMGLDAPTEIFKGIGATNHWAAIQIIGQMWQSHGQPLAMQFAEQLNDVYLRPALRDENFPRWEEVVIGIDPSLVTTKPDRSDDAQTALHEGAIGFKGYRKLANIAEDLAPSDDEFNQILELRRGRINVNEGTPPGGEPAPAGTSSNGQPPAPGPQGDSGRKTRIVASADVGAAQMALLNCRRVAGMRIKQSRVWALLEKDCSECADKSQGVRDELVASAVGPEPLVRIGADPYKLVEGGTDTFLPYLLSQGYSEAQAETLCEMVETYAARTLTEEKMPSLPSGFVAQMEGMKEMSDAVRA